MRETVVKNKQIEQNMFLFYIYIYISDRNNQKYLLYAC